MVIVDAAGRVLTVRQRGGPFKDLWLLPGGGLEPGESPEEAVRREVREETGLEVTALRPVRRYEVRCAPPAEYFGHVQLFSGEATGAVRAGDSEEPTAWVEPGPDLHPLLVRELCDAGVMAVDHADLEARCRAAGILITPLEGAS